MADHKMSHAEGVSRAVRWLRSTRRCSVVYAELSTGAGVIPDAIGWGREGSGLVEVKVSRQDYRRDRDKYAHVAGLLPGELRWYLTPPGLLRPEEVAEGWGLVEAHPTCVRVVRPAPRRELTTAELRTERHLLRSALRRYDLGVRFDAETGRFALGPTR